MTWRICVLLMGFIVTMSSFEATADEIKFPADPAHPYSFGLFIGIDGYPRLPEQYHLHSCVHDATAMHTFFSDQFHITQSVLLTDQGATRSGIGQALRELVSRVTAAKAHLDTLPAADRPPITVVMTYSGHGARVMRLKSETDSDPQDDAWVCYDSADNCDQVIRGYELLEIHEQLARLGASVLIISDSCHSGSNYRGIDSSQAQARTFPSAAQARSSTSSIDVADDGPQDNLFPEFSGNAPSSPDAMDDRSTPFPGFVFYSACSDGQSAYDVSCGDHREGRLTHVVLDLLENNHGDTTYRDMAAQVTVEFAAKFPNQTPEFHAAPLKADELFLGKGLPAPEAHILSQNASSHVVTLDLGDLSGIDEETVFTFYRNVDDLQRNQNPVATGSVADVQPMSCNVLLDGSTSVDSTAVAKYDRPRMAHVVVGIDGEVPTEIKDQLQSLANYKQIQLATDKIPATLVIHYFPNNQTIGFYSPTALPATRPSDADPVALRRVGYTGPKDADRFSENLLYEAGVQRLMTLRHDGAEALFSADIQSNTAGVDQIHPADGLTHVGEGHQFYVKVTNSSSTGLYFTVMGLDQTGNLIILYPRLPQDADGLVQPGVSVSVGKEMLTASIDGPLSKGSAELTQFKVIASDHREDFSALENPPTTGLASRGLRGQEDPLYQIVRDAVQGGPRGWDEGNSGNVVWQSADLDFDVIKK